jgi:putative MATE family efflux protein
MSIALPLQNSAAKPAGVSGPIVRLAGPLSAFFLIQSGVNLAVLSLIGRVGTAALAGVGAAAALHTILLALLFGLDAAVQASVARAVGAGKPAALGAILGGALLLGAPLGLLLAVTLWLGAPAALHAMIADPAAVRAGAAWARAAAPSLAFMAITIPANALWVGSGRPGRALAVTAATAPVQVGASALLMFAGGRPMGAGGAGAAMSVATLLGLALQLWLLLRPGGVVGLFNSRPSLGGPARLARLGWPISVQQALAQVGLMIAYPLIAGLGAPSLAVVNVLISVGTAPIQLAVAVGVAAGALAGQALGAGDPRRAGRIGWAAAALGLAVVAPFALAALVAPEPLLRVFLHDPVSVRIGMAPMRLLGVASLASAVGQVLSFVIRGAGATRIGAAIPFGAQWLVQLPASFVCVLILGLGVEGLVGVQAAVALGEAGLTAAIWAGGAWRTPAALRTAPNHGPP